MLAGHIESRGKTILQRSTYIMVEEGDVYWQTEMSVQWRKEEVSVPWREVHVCLWWMEVLVYVWWQENGMHISRRWRWEGRSHVHNRGTRHLGNSEDEHAGVTRGFCHASPSYHLSLYPHYWRGGGEGECGGAEDVGRGRGRGAGLENRGTRAG